MRCSSKKEIKILEQTKLFIQVHIKVFIFLMLHNHTARPKDCAGSLDLPPMPR